MSELSAFIKSHFKEAGDLADAIEAVFNVTRKPEPWSLSHAAVMRYGGTASIFVGRESNGITIFIRNAQRVTHFNTSCNYLQNFSYCLQELVDHLRGNNIGRPIDYNYYFNLCAHCAKYPPKKTDSI
jgi:hypothetical protein